MMLPILISVSVAPVSYFFCAEAAVDKVAASRRAAEKAPNRTCIAGILISLEQVFECVACSCLGALVARRSSAHSIPFPCRQQEKRRGTTVADARFICRRERNIPEREISASYGRWHGGCPADSRRFLIAPARALNGRDRSR